MNSRNTLMNLRICAVLACALVCSTGPARADDWPQWFGPQRDGVWREVGIVEKMPAQPKYRWRTPIGSGYAGPAVAGGKVYVADRQLKPGTKAPKDSFSRGEVPGDERVLCLDAAT